MPGAWAISARTRLASRSPRRAPGSRAPPPGLPLSSSAHKSTQSPVFTHASSSPPHSTRTAPSRRADCVPWFWASSVAVVAKEVFDRTVLVTSLNSTADEPAPALFLCYGTLPYLARLALLASAVLEPRSSRSHGGDQTDRHSAQRWKSARRHARGALALWGLRRGGLPMGDLQGRPGERTPYVGDSREGSRAVRPGPSRRNPARLGRPKVRNGGLLLQGRPGGGVAAVWSSCGVFQAARRRAPSLADTRAAVGRKVSGGTGTEG
jgi:hypothetical protein